MSDNLSVVTGFSWAFMDVLRQAEADWHLAVVGEDDGCVLGEHAWIDDSFSASEAADAFEVMTDVYFELGTYGANTERGFTLAQSFLMEDNLEPGGCNHGFLREGARLAFVHTSDEHEQSTFSWKDWVRMLQSSHADVVVSAWAGEPPTSGCAASSGDGYWEAVQATGGSFQSICVYGYEEYVAFMEALARASLPDWTHVQPALEPVPSTIVVQVEGAPSESWEWDAEAGEIVLPAQPAPGSTIELSYRPVQDCQESWGR